MSPKPTLTPKLSPRTLRTRMTMMKNRNRKKKLLHDAPKSLNAVWIHRKRPKSRRNSLRNQLSLTKKPTFPVFLENASQLLKPVRKWRVLCRRRRPQAIVQPLSLLMVVMRTQTPKAKGSLQGYEAEVRNRPPQRVPNN